MTEKVAETIKWSGCWEKRQTDAICRWIVCWTQNGDTTVGSIGGYSGGGAFQLEKFAILPDGRRAIESHEDLSNELSSENLELAEDCQDRSMEFHVEDDWFEAETLHLKPVFFSKFREENDLLLGSNAKIPDAILPFFLEIGLITKPITQ